MTDRALSPACADEAAFPGLAPAPRRGPAAPVVEAAASPLTLALAIGLLLVFSRAWVFPLAGEDVEAENSALVRNLFLPGYAMALALLAGDPRAALRAVIAGAVPLGLAALALASTLWSIAPELSLRRGFALLMTVAAALALAARLSWTDLARAVAATFLILALGSLALAVAAPGVGRMVIDFPGAWRGLWSEKNALGDYMALGACACLGAAALDARLRGLWAGAAVLCLMLVVLSTSKTSLMVFAVGLGAFGVTALATRHPAAAAGAALAVVTAVLAFGVGLLLKPHFVFDLLGKDATLTGRTVVWDTVLRRIAERPLAGFGYAAVWTDESGWGPLAWIAKEAHFTPRHAHNSWLETALDLGWLGVAGLAAFWGQAILRVLRARRGAWLAAPVLCGFAVLTLTETVMMNYNDFIWVLVTALVTRLGLKEAASGAWRAAPQPRNFERPWPV